MRVVTFLAPIALAACSSGDSAANNTAAPAPKPTAPAPRTPVMQITPATGHEDKWTEPRRAPDAPQTAPYGNLLDQPVVNAAPAG